MAFDRSAHLYDAIYGDYDYAGASSQVHRLIRQHCPNAGSLLDVACGTGQHLAHLQAHYRVEGLDLNADRLHIARRRNPTISFHCGDMLGFDLGQQFDAVLCLDSSIGYARTVDNLHQAIEAMTRHLKPGGVLLIVPWFTGDIWRVGAVTARFVDQPNLKIARISVSEVEGHISVMEMHYLVGTPSGIEQFVERHEMGLFTREQYLNAYRDAGLQATHDPTGLGQRGLYVGVLPRQLN